MGAVKRCVRCQQEFTGASVTTCPDDGEPLHPVLTEYVAEEEALVGRLLDGRYRIDALLGQGGMGLVLRAEHLYLGRSVALKLLHPELLLVREARERFLREARAASAVRHPNVVEIIDFGITPQGLHYLAMELLEGCDLLALVERAGPLEPEVLVDVARQVGDALDAIHAAGLVHRDLKPENLWVVDPDAAGGELLVKVLDFGIVSMVEGDEGGDRRRLTKTGRTLGSPNYMSPEQVRGDRVDARADVYALGCVLWELATGRPAFEGANAMELMMRQLQEPARPPSESLPEVPRWVDEALLRALEKRPDDRFPSASALASALAAGLGGDSGRSKTTPRPVTGMAAAKVPNTAEGAALDLEAPPGRRGRLGLVAAVGLAAAVAAVLLVVRPFGAGGTEPTLSGPQARQVDPVDEVAQTPPPEPEEPEEPAEASASDVETAPEVATIEPARAAKTVLIEFRIEPEGAEIWRDGQRLGAAPLSLAVAREERPVEYELRHGDVRKAILVSHGAPKVIELALPEPEPKAEATPEPRARTRKRRPRRKVRRPETTKGEPKPMPDERRGHEKDKDDDAPSVLMKPELP